MILVVCIHEPTLLPRYHIVLDVQGVIQGSANIEILFIVADVSFDEVSLLRYVLLVLFSARFRLLVGTILIVLGVEFTNNVQARSPLLFINWLRQWLRGCLLLHHHINALVAWTGCGKCLVFRHIGAFLFDGIVRVFLNGVYLFHVLVGFLYAFPT